MRRRLLVSTLAVAVLTVVLFGVPLGIVFTRNIYTEAEQKLKEEATTIVRGIEIDLAKQQVPSREDIGGRYPDRYVEIKTPYGFMTSGRPPPASRRISASERSAEPVAISVEVSMDQRALGQQTTEALLLVAGLGLLAIAVAVASAVIQSRRLTLPLLDLARTAERLGSGEGRPGQHRYGVRELDRVAEVLDRSAVRIHDLLAAEREFATDASHQLRTPLTGLTMRLEELVASASDPDVVREEGQAAIIQAERLTKVIDELLAHARAQRDARAEPIRVDEIVQQQVTEWKPAFGRVGRGITVTGKHGLRAYASRGGLGQIIATLLENSLAHGGGDVTITVRGGDGGVTIEVADEGPGISEHLGPKVFERNVSGAGGTGLGLHLARALAAADGGRLELVRSRPAVFSIFLRPVGSERNRVVSGPA